MTKIDSSKKNALAVLALALVIVWAAPLLGLAAAGLPVATYLRFPPRTEYVPHAPFAWGRFILFSLPALAAIGLFLWAARKPARAAVPPAGGLPHSFPAWGWLGIGLIAAGWLLAWTEGLVPPEWRRQTFTPLWLGYVLAMNALAHRRGGRAPLIRQTAQFLWLFPLSALFWWLFEHLNRLAGNWHYSGIEDSGDWDYFLQGSLLFSTVLPAVASTWAWLKTFPRLEAITLPALPGHPALAWIALVAGALALAAIGLAPEALFAMLWVAPLLVLLGLQQVLLGETLLAPLARGDWRPLLQPAIAALVCGFFWELWNYGSLAKWHYSVPYVQRFHLFEMPLLGYAGYLPFGVTCAVVMDLAARLTGGRNHSCASAAP